VIDGNEAYKITIALPILLRNEAITKNQTCYSYFIQCRSSILVNIGERR
jgi:hypothetical protein